MNINSAIIGKTIANVTEMKMPQYDDTGWLKIDFTDGTHCVIQAYYGSYSGLSQDEYPTRIEIIDDDEDLCPSK